MKCRACDQGYSYEYPFDCDLVVMEDMWFRGSPKIPALPTREDKNQEYIIE